ncbi:LAGLIDADG family homing endonuclease [Candidatus Kaiserbacteria bacterium]|nr:LAGLIDADG family homing endonuclease [Candidatus Kaiserbacteria bacterium]
MKRIYPASPRRYINTHTGVSRISYFNVSLGEYIKEKSVHLLRAIPSMSVELKRAFLQSFFDDEGCVNFRPHRNHRRIRGYQKDVAILSVVKRLLADFYIESRIQLPNEIVIIGKENFLKFQKEIDFSPGVRINGKRSNSIWKKSLEKRELLERAIASYKPVGSNGVHRT